MSTKFLFVLPFAIAVAGCAATSDTSSPQSSQQCANLSGAAYLECQKNITPAASTKSDTFKQVRPKAPNGDFGSIGSR